MTASDPFDVGDVDLADSDDYDPATDCVCQSCGVRFNGSDSSGGHHVGAPYYGGCCQSFGSMTAFERHLTGPTAHRTCRTPHELHALGWTCDESRVWRLPAPKTNPWATR